MPFDSNGNSSVTRQRAVTGQTVLAEQVNVPFDDVEAMFNQTILRSGVAPMTGNLNMNGFRITGSPEATNPTDLVSYSQLTALTTQLAQSVPTGVVQMFRRKSAPSGWIVEGGTIGNITSGATFSNASAFNLYSLMWSEFTNAELPIQDSSGVATTRGASALADWNANKRIPLFDSRSRFPRAADAGLGYDASITPGSYQADAIKSHSINVTDPGHNHFWGNFAKLLLVGGGPAGAFAATNPNPQGDFQTVSNTTGITASYSGATETRPLSSVYLFCIKL